MFPVQQAETNKRGHVLNIFDNHGFCCQFVTVWNQSIYVQYSSSFFSTLMYEFTVEVFLAVKDAVSRAINFIFDIYDINKTFT